jgi:putative membrane protein
MQFLKTLFWIVLAVMLAILASNNWRDVTLDLWGDLQIDIKVPVLLLAMVLIGFLPTWLVMRGKLWRVTRNYAADGRPTPVAPPPSTAREDEHSA